MTDPLHISEAASIALHTAVWLARQPDGFGQGPTICRALGFSPAHFAKVIQTLVRAGLVETQRGPAGGVRLARPPAAIPLLALYEAIEGPLQTDRCLLDPRRCRVSRCPLGEALVRLRREFRKVLASATLDRVAAATEWTSLAAVSPARKTKRPDRRSTVKSHSKKKGDLR